MLRSATRRRATAWRHWRCGAEGNAAAAQAARGHAAAQATRAVPGFGRIRVFDVKSGLRPDMAGANSSSNDSNPGETAARLLVR